jgi:hypothetical protein
MVPRPAAREPDGMTHLDSTSLTTGRTLGLTWLTVATPVAVVGTLLVLVSDQSDDRTAGALLWALAAIGFAICAWILSSAHKRTRLVSFVASGLWVVGAAVVYPTQEFAADRLWVSGLPVLGAIVTAVVAWWAPRPA